MLEGGGKGGWHTVCYYGIYEQYLSSELVQSPNLLNLLDEDQSLAAVFPRSWT